MTAILFDGFDHDDAVDVWTGGTSSGSSGTSVAVRTGTRRWSFGVDTFLYRALSPSEVDDGVFLGAAVYMDSGNAAFDNGFELVTHEGGLTIKHMSCKLRNGFRSIRLFRGTDLLDETDVNLWHFNSWNYLELGVKHANSGGTAEVRLNGITVLSFTGDTQNGGTGICDVLLIRSGTGGTGQICLADDVYLLNEQGSVNNTFLGDTRCYPLYPNGNGTLAAPLSGSDGNSTDNYLLIDEAGTPVTTDYVFSPNDGDQETYTFQDLPVTLGTIRGVEVRMHAAKDDTGTKQIRAITRRSGSDAFGPDHILAAIPTYQTHRDLDELDPHAGPGAWTITNVNATEWGVEVRP